MINKVSPFIVDLSEPVAVDKNLLGPKAANQALLNQAGLDAPGGFCITAAAYHHQLQKTGLANVITKLAGKEPTTVRNIISDIRICLFEKGIDSEILEALLCSWRQIRKISGGQLAVRSSALMEDTQGSNFAGQFESFLGLDTETDFITSVKACWAALWSPRVIRYMESRHLNPASTAMAVLVQPLIQARASGGGMSRAADNRMTITATWGLGSSIAQGEIVPDRYELDRNGRLLETVSGHKSHSIHCRIHETEPVANTVRKGQVNTPCLNHAGIIELGEMMLKAEELMATPVEIEWAQDETGIRIVQARPLSVAPDVVPDEIWRKKPGIRGHASGIGWAAGKACVVNCECELSRVGVGDILVTKVAGPALSRILPRVSGVVAELGGSTSHLASLARERGIPMVLGLLGATSRIPDGAVIGVDGVAGVVRWDRPDAA